MSGLTPLAGLLLYSEGLSIREFVHLSFAHTCHMWGKKTSSEWILESVKRESRCIGASIISNTANSLPVIHKHKKLNQHTVKSSQTPSVWRPQRSGDLTLLVFLTQVRPVLLVTASSMVWTTTSCLWRNSWSWSGAEDC